MRTPHPGRVVALLYALVLAGSCTLKEPYARTNPFDPDGIVEFSLTGPDSVHAIGESFQTQLTTDPPLPSGDNLVRWRAFPAGECFPDLDPRCSDALLPLLTPGANGTFVVGDASAKYLKVVVVVDFGEVSVPHEVMVGQRAVTLELSCSPWTLPENPCVAPVARDSTVRLFPRMTDANSNPVRRPYYATQRAQVTSRNPAVVTVLTVLPPQYDPLGAARLLMVAPGTAWVVFRVDAATDSVLMMVAP